MENWNEEFLSQNEHLKYKERFFHQDEYNQQYKDEKESIKRDDNLDELSDSKTEKNSSARNSAVAKDKVKNSMLQNAAKAAKMFVMTATIGTTVAVSPLITDNIAAVEEKIPVIEGNIPTEPEDWELPPLAEEVTEPEENESEEVTQPEENELEELPEPEEHVHVAANKWKIIQPASCESKGSQILICSECGVTMQSAEIMQLEHELGDWIVKKPSTCQKQGTEIQVCNLCQKTIHERGIKLSKHVPVQDLAVNATCTATGLTEGSHCSVCGTIIVPQQQIPVRDHEIVIQEAVEASCTSEGLTEGQYCSVCGKVLKKQKVVDSVGHEIVIQEAVEASCTSEGLTEGQYCSVCGEVLKKQKVIAPTAHQEVKDAAVEASCTSEGLTEGSHCSVCGTILQKQTTIPALEHTIVTIDAVEVTCTENGHTGGTECSVCGEVLSGNVINAPGHSEVQVEGEEPTCISGGVSSWSYCEVCDEILVEAQELPELGHQWVLQQVDEGSSMLFYVCDRCGEISYDGE